VFEKHLCIKSSHYEKYRQFLVTQRKPSHATTKLTLFTVSKGEWNTKEGHWYVPEECPHYTYCGMPKGTSRAEATSNSEKVKPVALAVVKLC